MRSKEPTHIISLGAGVQSSTLALMAARGELTPTPIAAIFADTKAEPIPTYKWLDWLETQLPFPVHRVAVGDLENDFLTALKDPKGRCAQPPFMVANEKKGAARLWRKCTKDYKVIPIRRIARQISGGGPIMQWIGISTDEAHRMKKSDVKYVTNHYPLIELGLSRHNCIAWLQRNGYSIPPKSACVFCPYSSDQQLRTLRDSSPKDWERLIRFDHAMREARAQTINGSSISGGLLYVHRSCKPIDQVDLSTAVDHGQIDMFGNECEGMCGI